MKPHVWSQGQKRDTLILTCKKNQKLTLWDSIKTVILLSWCKNGFFISHNQLRGTIIDNHYPIKDGKVIKQLCDDNHLKITAKWKISIDFLFLHNKQIWKGLVELLLWVINNYHPLLVEKIQFSLKVVKNTILVNRYCVQFSNPTCMCLIDNRWQRPSLSNQ
jgi:hypothetical protein